MFKMFTAALLMSTFIAPPALAEEVYKRVEKNGIPSFSDTQSKGAEKIIIETFNVQKIPPLTEQPRSYSAPTEAIAQYSKLEISSPADQTTLRNEHRIVLQAILVPGLRSGHTMEFLDNGQSLQPASKETRIELVDFERGRHSLSVRVLDNQGKAVITSSSVTVHIFRTIIKPPPAPAA